MAQKLEQNSRKANRTELKSNDYNVSKTDDW